jgi:hypothetical protein
MHRQGEKRNRRGGGESSRERLGWRAGRSGRIGCVKLRIGDWGGRGGLESRGGARVKAKARVKKKTVISAADWDMSMPERVELEQGNPEHRK